MKRARIKVVMADFFQGSVYKLQRSHQRSSRYFLCMDYIEIARYSKFGMYLFIDNAISNRVQTVSEFLRLATLITNG